jgi:hypothetical protein
MRWITGFLLVGAAVLKAAQLIFDPASVVLNPLGRYFLPVQVGIELTLGLLVLSGLYWRTLRWVVAALFGAFAGYSLYLAIGGAASCGCFGSLRVNPWWTFGLDIAVVVGLLSSVLVERRSRNIDRPRTAALFNPERSARVTRAVAVGAGLNDVSADTRRGRRQAVVAIAGIAVVCTALLFRYAGQQTALGDGNLTSVGGLVILEPERWIGQKLPIAASVDLDLSSGDWIVLLHRHDCPECLEQVPKYEQRAAAGERVALVEVPPFDRAGSDTFFAAKKVSDPLGSVPRSPLYGRLTEDHEWFVQTPVEIRLVDGRVSAVKTHEH